MLYAVTVEPLNSVFFLSERPEEDRWEVQDGIELDISSIYAMGADRPEQVLCTSTSNPKHYILFKYQKDINLNEFRPTGKNFGGVFARSSWERFRKQLDSSMPFLDLPDDEPPGATEEAIRMIKRRD